MPSRTLDAIIASLRGSETLNAHSPFVEAILEAICVVVADMNTGEIVFATHSAERLFGYYVRGELVGVNVDALVPQAARGMHAQHRSDFSGNPHPRPMGGRRKLQGQKRDGSLFDLVIGLDAAKIGGQRCAIAIILEQ